MEFINSKKLLLDAKKNGYAIPAFNFYNMETLQSIIRGCEFLKSPVILAISPSSIEYCGKDYILGLANSAMKKSTIPMVFHLDHHENIDDLKESIDLGFKSIMIDGSKLNLEKNIALVKEITDYAHLKGVTVEAELGRVVMTNDLEKLEGEEFFTNVKESIKFVNETNIDSLAISIGTAHGLYIKEPKLNFQRLKEIKSSVDLPLVLHGASGINEKDIRKSIALGINKINIATELKVPFTNAIKNYLFKNPNCIDLRKYVPYGKEAICNVVKEKIILCNSYNRI
ncbi:class II fructose-bisphosphate aldolase [Clostridium senegalense]|uniref:class II fructose-bisphosphate aldolase n=1 Tax=Clostridium senegalense TaxID=1465809 RepID=UPI0002898528|nr:ketose-bisphosphate aldolase [Clostridium senegalense]